MTIGLINPTVLGTAGPTFATMQNTEMTAIDTHDHSSGKGNTISLGGSNNGATVAGDVSFTGFGPINQSYSRFAAVAAPGLAQTVYVLTGGDLWYRNNSGNNIQLTTGATIMSNGTGTFNGIYDVGGTGYSNGGTQHIATAGFDQSKGQYRFSSSNVDFNATASNSSIVAAGGFWAATIGAFPVRIGLQANWDNTNKRPAGGFGFDITSGLATGSSLVVGADPGLAGTYTSYDAFRLDPLTTVTGGIYSYGLRINSGLKGQTYEGTFAGMFFTAPVGANSAVHNTLQIGTNIDVASGGTPGTGFGARVLFSNPVSAAAGYTQVTTGTIDGAWVGTVGVNGGFYIHGATSGVATGTAGFQLMGAGGSDCIGIGGTPIAAQGFTTYSDLFPASDNTRNIGSAALNFATLYAKNITANGTNLTLTGTSTIVLASPVSASSTLAVTGAITGSSTATATEFIPSATGTFSTGVGGIWKNTQILAWGQFSSGGVNGGSYNVTGNAAISNTSQYAITLTTPLTSTATVVVVANVNQNDTSNGWMCHSVMNGTGQVVVTIFKGDNTKVVNAFNFVVIGQP